MLRKDIINYSTKVNYKKRPGMIAWQLHRISGLLLGLYFIMHIFANSGYMEWFNDFFSNKITRVFLLLVILFHTFNGIRIILIDFSNGAERDVFMKQFVAVVTATIIFFIIGILFII